MAYIKTCDKCGARISMRQMSQGQWVAFDVGSDEPHEHGVAGRNANRVIVKKNKPEHKNKKITPGQIMDRSGEIYELSDIPKEWMDLTEANLIKLFIQIIDERRKAQIQYEDKNGDFTNREIYPISLIQGYVSEQSSSKTVKVVSYCMLRKDYRTFLLSSIDEILVDQMIPKTFISQFESLDKLEKKRILDGTNFYGTYHHAPIKTIEDSTSYQELTKPKPKPKPKPEPKPEPKTKTKTKKEAKLAKNKLSNSDAGKDINDEINDFLTSMIPWAIIGFWIYVTISG
jgi:hypothetical protein